MSDNDLIRRGDALAAVQEWTYCCDAEETIAALPAVTVGVQERVQHKKRGSTYRVLGRGKVQTDTPLSDYAEVVVYKGEADGLVWVRPVGEFDDGRFAALDLTPAPDAAAIREAAENLASFLEAKHQSYMAAKGRNPADYVSGYSIARDKANTILALLPKGGNGQRVYMGQIMAECDCPREAECQAAGRCIAEERK